MKAKSEYLGNDSVKDVFISKTCKGLLSPVYEFCIFYYSLLSYNFLVIAKHCRSSSNAIDVRSDCADHRWLTSEIRAVIRKNNRGIGRSFTTQNERYHKHCPSSTYDFGRGQVGVSIF